MKRKTAYICEECGYQSSGHLGKCPECNTWNSIKEILVEDKKLQARRSHQRPDPF